MATQYLITWLCQKKDGTKGISCGMSIKKSALDFLISIKDFHSEEYAILSVVPLTEEEAAYILSSNYILSSQII